MSARTAGYIQNPPPWAKTDRPADEGHSTGSIGFISPGMLTPRGPKGSD